MILLWLPGSMAAEAIDLNQQVSRTILNQSDVYIDSDEHNISYVLAKGLLQPYTKTYLNTGIRNATIWIRFHLANDTNQTAYKILIVTSPLLEHIKLYKQSSIQNPQYRGVRYITEAHHTLMPYFHLTLPPNSSETYYLQVRSLLTPVDFTLKLDAHEHFEFDDRRQQLVDILLIGFVLALMFYSFILYFYTKDKSYLFYSFYLFALIYQQFTYLGLTQIYLPLAFIRFDMQIPILKIGLLIITSALFAMQFLKTRSLGKIHTLYRLFIAVTLLEILLFPRFQNLYPIIFTGMVFIFFNLGAGVVSYKRGNKQARLFIVGFSIVCFSYFLLILDALGITSIVQGYQNILMFGTAFEALILSLAFADRYLILQKAKARADARILEESTQRADIIEREVIKKTDALNRALETKELLLKEVHHRVKNNLQIILSIIRLQRDEIEDAKIGEKCIDLENRINAISKTYTMLLIKENIEEIDMAEYIEALLLDIQETMQQEDKHIEIKTDIEAKVPLRESVYLGLIVNELVTNAYKYAFQKEGTITISLHQNNSHYRLIIQDNGQGYDAEQTKVSLGMKLIYTLVHDQLGGTIEKETMHHTHYTIRFTI